MCSKIDASQQDKKFLLEQIFELGIGSALGTKMGGGQTSRPDNRTESHAKISHAKMPVHAAETPEGPEGLWGLIETRLIQKRLFRRAFFQERLGAFVANCSS
jgi:hypothetical protein